jgi:hypothetical protein
VLSSFNVCPRGQWRLRKATTAQTQTLVAMPQEMKVYELKSAGQLTRDLVNEVGDEYSISERLKNKIFGVGQLRYTSGNPILDEFYDRHNQTIKTHFDWTKKGAVIRIRTMANIYAIGLNDKGFKKVKLIKSPDYIYAIPFLPFLDSSNTWDSNKNCKMV